MQKAVDLGRNAFGKPGVRFDACFGATRTRDVNLSASSGAVTANDTVAMQKSKFGSLKIKAQVLFDYAELALRNGRSVGRCLLLRHSHAKPEGLESDRGDGLASSDFPKTAKSVIVRCPSR